MGILLVYDCTQELTFNNISNWLKQIDAHASEDVMKVLVCNKIDLPNRCISTEQGQALASQFDLTYYETSALEGTNINELFHNIAKAILDKKPEETMNPATRSAYQPQMQQVNNNTFSGQN